MSSIVGGFLLALGSFSGKRLLTYTGGAILGVQTYASIRKLTRDDKK
jgi:hypothetical protein